MKKYLPVFAICIFFCAFIPKANTRHIDPTVEKLVLENKKIKVTEFDSEPGKGVCGIGMHSHPAHLTVLLTEAEVTVTLPDGKKIHQKAPAGAAFWSEAETHTVMNSGGKEVKSYIIEPK